MDCCFRAYRLDLGNLTMQSLLEPLHADHVLRQFKGLAFGLHCELSVWRSRQRLNTGSDTQSPAAGEEPTESSSSPSLVEQLLLLSDVAFITHRQILHDHLGVLLVRLADGTFVGFELNDVGNFVHTG